MSDSTEDTGRRTRRQTDERNRDGGAGGSSGARPGRPEGRSSSQPRVRAAKAAALAARQLGELTGRDPEAVVGMERTQQGWRIEIEALELRRIPETTDVLACYAVELDDHGDLVGCRRLRRYVRGAAEED